MGYYDGQQVKDCLITPYIPKPDTSANKKLGLFTKKDFRYDPEFDCNWSREAHLPLPDHREGTGAEVLCHTCLWRVCSQARVYPQQRWPTHHPLDL